MGTIEKTDGELVEASRRGELEAFGHLVARYQDVVCAVGYSSTGDRVLGEDVAQDTFVAAWGQLDRVRDAMRIGPWLCGIARNIGRKARKRLRREQPDESDERAATTPNAFDELARGDSERIVRDALARVPETYREVLILYYCEDQSIRDVAVTLGIAETAVMQRLSRGRKYLADSVSSLVERSLRGDRPRRDLVAAVLAAIAVYAIPSRVDASNAVAKGSTMQKLLLGASALAAVGVTGYLVHSHTGSSTATTVAAHTGAKPLLHYGAGAPRPTMLGPTAPRHTTAARQTSIADLGYLPPDSDVVLGVDMARIQKSALWQQFVAPQLATNSMHEFVAKCGFDPLASLTAVSMGFTGVGQDSNPVGTVVVHGLDRTKVIDCMKNTAPDMEGVKLDGDAILISMGNEGKNGLGVIFVDPTTAVVAIGEAGKTKAGLEQVAAGNRGLQSSPEFAELLANINTDDPLWGVVGPSSPLFGIINESLSPFTPTRVKAVYGSMDITGSLSIQAGARLGSPAQVTALVADAQAQIDKLAAAGMLSQYVDQLDIAGDGGDLIVSVSANAMQLLHMAASGSVDAEATPATPEHPGTVSVSASIGK